MQRNIVLLPLPLAPMTTRTSPMATLRSMPSSTRLSPKLLRTPSSRTIGTPFVSWPALIAVSVVTLTSPGEFETAGTTE